MPNISNTWTPVPGVTSQIISARKKGDIPWLTTNFTPSNNLGAAVNTATYTNADGNTIYQFKINSVCGGSTSTDSAVAEGINFQCLPEVNVLLGSNNISVLVENIPSDITKLVFYLFASNGTTVVQISPEINISGGDAAYNFTGLTLSTTYKIGISQVAVLVNNGTPAEVVSSPYTCQIVAMTTDSGGGLGSNVSVINNEDERLNSMSPVYGSMTFPMNPGTGPQQALDGGTKTFSFVIENLDTITSTYVGYLRKNGSLIQTISGSIPANSTENIAFAPVTFSGTVPLDTIDINFGF